MQVSETADTTRLDNRTMLLLLVTVAALVVVDAVLGRTLFQTMVPALAADVAVVLAVVIARRNLVASTVYAAAGSIVVSGMVEGRYRLGLDLDIHGDSVVGDGAWPGVAELAGMAVLCAMVTRSRPASEAMLATASFGAALMAIVGWRQGGHYGELFLLTLGVAFAATVATGLYSRSIERGRVEDARAARQNERDAIARELHDLVAHHVTGIVVQAQAARLVATSRPDVAADALSSIEQAGADALRSMRAMVGALRSENGDAPIAPTATVDDIRKLATSNGVADLPVTIELDAIAEQLPSSVVASLHRIAIEAITNARRHGSGATTIGVSIVCEPEQVTLTATNDGAVVTDRGQGFGLIGIAERVAALGGRFEAGPRPSGGWSVTTVLPTTLRAPRPGLSSKSAQTPAHSPKHLGGRAR